MVTTHSDPPDGGRLASSGILPLDERIGGLDKGGFYLIAGPPGPAKLVATLQFLHAGLAEGEPALLITSAQALDILEVSRAWGFDLEPAWRDGRLEILGFREDFEMRVLRSAEPEDALAELDALCPAGVTRVAVDPGSAFFQGGARSLLGRGFSQWARRRPATVLATLAVDSGQGLPSSAEWLVQATNAVLMLGNRPDGLYQVTVRTAVPNAAGEGPVTLELLPGKGLSAPSGFPARRRADRKGGDPTRLLLLSLAEEEAGDLNAWASGSFKTDVVADPLEAVAGLQADPTFGCVLVHSSRKRVVDTVRACRAMRPLTSAPILVASDDAMRSSDRVEILEAGADDCLSGGIDVRELAARMRQAVESGGKPVREETEATAKPEIPQGGMVAVGRFGDEARRRAGHPTLGVFSVLRVDPEGRAPSDLAEILSEEIRDEQGDLLAVGSNGYLVLLQGARRGHARSFLNRLRARLRPDVGKDPGVAAEVLTHPSDRAHIQRLLSEAGDSGSPEGQDRRAEGTGGSEV